MFPKCNRYYINTNDHTGISTSPMISRASTEQHQHAPDYERVCAHAQDLTTLWRDKELQRCYNNKDKQGKALVKAEE